MGRATHDDDAAPIAVERAPPATGDAPPAYDSETGAQAFAYSEKRKYGVTGAVFLILNKMIGTGSEPSLIRLFEGGSA
jgi:hypothetical protein